MARASSSADSKRVKSKKVGVVKVAKSDNKSQKQRASNSDTNGGEKMQAQLKPPREIQKDIRSLASNFVQEVMKMTQNVQSDGKRGRAASTAVRSTQTSTMGSRGRKVAEIKEGLLSGKTDSELVDQGFNLSTIRTIKWALRRDGELPKQA